MGGGGRCMLHVVCSLERDRYGRGVCVCVYVLCVCVCVVCVCCVCVCVVCVCCVCVCVCCVCVITSSYLSRSPRNIPYASHSTSSLAITFTLSRTFSVTMTPTLALISIPACTHAFARGHLRLSLPQCAMPVFESTLCDAESVLVQPLVS